MKTLSAKRIVSATVLALSVNGASIANAGETEAGKSEKSEFWGAREQSYRESLRGPFTAIRADYLTHEEKITLVASEDGVTSERGDASGAPAISISFDDRGFHVAPQGGKPATHAGKAIRQRLLVGDYAGDEEDFRLGRFLLGFGMQGPDLGRVLVFDGRLLDENFHGFPTFAETNAFRIEARVSAGAGDETSLGTSRGLVKSFVRAARIEFEIDGVACTLTGFRSSDDVEGPLFIPFTDATSGEESYAVGRYLRAEPDGDTAIIDFNHATNPWCAYCPYYNCVLPPDENRLPVAIRAGERAPAKH